MNPLLFYLVNAVVEIYLMLYYQSAFFDTKRSPISAIPRVRGRIYGGIFLLAILGLTTVLTWKNPWPFLNLALLSVVFLLIAGYFFKAHLKDKIVHLCLFGAIMVVSEVLLSLASALLSSRLLLDPTVAAIVLTVIRFVIIWLIVFRFGNRNQTTIQFSILQHNFVVGMIVLGYTLLMSNLFLLNDQTQVPVLFNTVVIFIMFLFFYFFVEVIQKSDQKELENRTLKMRQQAYQEYYRSLQDNEQHVKKIRHDLRNQLIAVSAVPDDRVKTEIRKLVDEMESGGHKMYSNNPVLQLILSSKLQLLEIERDNCTIKVQLPAELPMDTADLGVLVGNSLDNSIEALHQLPLAERKLVIEMEQEAGIVIFQFRNTHRQGHHDDFRTTKPNKEMHGFGLKSIQAIVEKYDGYMDITVTDEFRLLISLPIFMAK